MSSQDQNTTTSVESHAVGTNGSTLQSLKGAVVDGPIGQGVQKETAKTSAEFKDLANSRQTPQAPAATGQPLTHYHSMFYRLLSWKNPRATAIAFASVVAFIFAARYLNIIRWTLKALYTSMGVTALAELVGKATLGHGFATQMRPRKYYTIKKESLERFLDDIEQLINFCVIEFQRILFCENVWVTLGAFFSSFISYWLIKFVPLWGLSLIGTIITFLAPLVYIQNQELIDAHLNQAGDMINAQASQVRDLAAHHTSKATETMKSYAGEYTQKAQEMIGSVRQQATGSSKPVKSSDFPKAPKDDLISYTDTAPAPGVKSEPLASI